jgi:histidine triad (HIT) family protein
MNDCVFCRIVQKEVSSEILFENDEVITILDINPIHYGHALVIPKKHCRDFLELPPRSYQAILEAARVVCQALVRGLQLDGYNLFSNNGHSAGQSVFHFHLHVTPRYPNDDIRFVLELKKYSDGEMRKYAELIKQHIDSI